LTNLHGDIVATQPNTTGATTLSSYTETDEYGNTLTGTPGRYGYLGAHQRSTDTVGGLTLMGARLYNPSVGLFASPDPVVGGNLTPYVYPADPINQFDLNGRECGPCKGNVVTGLSFLYYMYGPWRKVIRRSGAWHDAVQWATGYLSRSLGAVAVDWAFIQSRTGVYIRYECDGGYWKVHYYSMHTWYRWHVGVTWLIFFHGDFYSSWQKLF
jgi:RHS repeat-associated protein